MWRLSATITSWRTCMEVPAALQPVFKHLWRGAVQLLEKYLKAAPCGGPFAEATFAAKVRHIAAAGWTIFSSGDGAQRCALVRSFADISVSLYSKCSNLPIKAFVLLKWLFTLLKALVVLYNSVVCELITLFTQWNHCLRISSTKSSFSLMILVFAH